jgi:hypothetical protein
MLGFLDADDETNVPIGLAAQCRNVAFDLTSVRTRDGIATTMQGVNKSPITGLIGGLYTPETATENFFQLPIIFDMAGALQYEAPVGSGDMTEFKYDLFTPPLNAHMVSCQTYNKIFAAFSNLNTPLSTMAVIDPKTKKVWPYGMKPFGWTWVKGTQVLGGEVATPTVQGGNGHTYRCVDAGTTGAVEPVWPVTYGGFVMDGTATWQECTAVMANRLPTPSAPTLTLGSGGTFAAALDIYIVMTLKNTMGETLPSIPAFVHSTAAATTVNVQIPSLAQLPGWFPELAPSYIPTGANVYVASVAHGASAPSISTYEKFNSAPIALGAVEAVTAAGAGAAPPASNTARVTPGQLPTPVIAPPIQRIPAGSTVAPPGAPGLALAAGGFGSGRTVYILLTLTNSSGETTPGVTANITTTAGGQGVQVSLASNYGPTVTGVNIYEKDVSVGSDVPPTNAYQLFGSFALGASPIITASASGANPPLANTATLPNGSFPAGRDIYVLQTYLNSNGETTAGPATSIINSNADDAVLVTAITVPEDANNNPLYTITLIGIYEADVATGTPAPPSSSFSLVGYYAVGATPFILETAVGPNPPIVNGTGPGGAIVADTTTGGINGSQGYRFAAIMFMNQNYTVSGFTPASVIQYDVDEDGWEIGIFNVAQGPDYVLGRAIAFTVADGSNDGPFFWIGNVNLQIPAANFVYPQTFPSDSINQSATFFQDNVTVTGTFNFTDEYLESSNDVTDRLDVIWPNQAVHVTYCPSVDRIFQSGVPGYYSGWWVSLAADPESYYADLSYISVGSDDGERSWGVIEYRGTVYGLRERSGMTLGANPANPQQWKATKRWSQRGPCGPRAFDACDDFMLFVHRSGIWKYEETVPVLVTKEIPYWWKTINWLYANTICVKIDHEKHEAHILVPVGNSKVPNQEIVLNYLEGWNEPIHFSVYSGKEISVDACRKYSINDIQGYVCDRIERFIPPPNDPNQPQGGEPAYGSAGIPFLDPSFYSTQFVYGSSGPDGTVQAVNPGTFNDNGTGIDSVYECVCSQTTMALCKFEGFSLNAKGNGTLYPYALAGRAMVTSWDENGQAVNRNNILPLRPVDLDVMESEGLSRMAPSKINERWRMRFWNGKVPDAWFSLKLLIMYTIPMFSARDESEAGG